MQTRSVLNRVDPGLRHQLLYILYFISTFAILLLNIKCLLNLIIWLNNILIKYVWTDKYDEIRQQLNNQKGFNELNVFPAFNEAQDAVFLDLC